jgi:hypothetical protein
MRTIRWKSGHLLAKRKEKKRTEIDMYSLFLKKFLHHG